uniref:Putative salivary secreted peptide n=1 Tax=Ixodes pacificus TaxID=29930 RepID=Q6B8D1_IXOPA|nr:putative salivary secreted peptide [Ixodes pacificus]
MNTREQVVPLLPWVGTAVALGLSLYLYKCRGGKGRVNLGVDLSNPKIVNSVDIEDLGNKAVFCRCWKSKKFPYCDGSHNKHNEECGDNVGPLIVKRKDA